MPLYAFRTVMADVNTGTHLYEYWQSRVLESEKKKRSHKLNKHTVSFHVEVRYFVISKHETIIFLLYSDIG